MASGIPAERGAVLSEMSSLALVVVGLLAAAPERVLVIVPLVLMTIARARRGDFEAHKRIARWTWPVWMYVSITGVLVYFFLYRWFPKI